MMSAKYQQYFKRMLEVEKELFDNFRVLHDNYALNPEKYQKEFNKEGERALQVIAHWETKLCRQSEIGGYSFSTPKLAEKFREEIRQNFPEIDRIGIILEEDISQNNLKNSQENFYIKKISL